MFVYCDLLHLVTEVGIYHTPCVGMVDYLCSHTSLYNTKFYMIYTCTVCVDCFIVYRGDEEQVMPTYICITGMTCLRLAQIRGSQSHQTPCTTLVVNVIYHQHRWMGFDKQHNRNTRSEKN